MDYDNIDVRDAYRRGARDVFDALYVRLASTEMRDLRRWLERLEEWRLGRPPAPPYEVRPRPKSSSKASEV